MPTEQEPVRPPPPAPAWAGRALLLLAMLLMAFSLLRNDGWVGAVVVLAALTLSALVVGSFRLLGPSRRG